MGLLLKTCVSEDLFYDLDARVLSVKCFFMLNDAQSFQFTWDAFHIHLKRWFETNKFGKKTLHPDEHKRYESFLGFVRKLWDLTHGNERITPSALREEIKRERLVTSRDWLLHEIDVFLSKRSEQPIN